MSHPIEITDGSFESDVLNADKPVLVDFWAEWCGPCRMVAPTITEIAEEQDGLVVGKMDIDSNPTVPGRYGIRSIPTLMVFKGGEVVARIVGVRPKDQIMAEIAPHMGG